MLTDIRSGLQANLATINGLQAYAGEQAAVLVAPTATVLIPSIDYLRGGTAGPHGIVGRLEVEILVQVNAQLIDQAFQTLAACADTEGDLSVYLAVASDPTLGGAADDCVVQSFRPLGLDDYSAIDYVAGIFTCTVTARRS